MSRHINRRKRSRAILRAYRHFLLGEDQALVDLEISYSEIQKMKEFHEKLEEGQSAYIIGRALRIPEFIARDLGLMYQDFQKGRPVRDLYPSLMTRPRIAKVYTQLLLGVSERDLQDNGFFDYEIEQAKLYRQFETADVLPAIVSQKTDIKISTVKKLQKIFREYQKTEAVSGMEMRAGMIA